MPTLQREIGTVSDDVRAPGEFQESVLTACGPSLCQRVFCIHTGNVYPFLQCAYLPIHIHICVLCLTHEEESVVVPLAFQPSPHPVPPWATLPILRAFQPGVNTSCCC